MRIVVAYFLPPLGEPVDVGDLFRQTAAGGDDLQHVHVQPWGGLVLVTMFLACDTRQKALEAAERICSSVTAESLSRSWVLVEVAADRESDSVP